MVYRLWAMTPGAVDKAGERGAERPTARVSGALGVSVVLHVLGAVALWRGASEPARPMRDRPLEVELVWRGAAEGARNRAAGGPSTPVVKKAHPPGERTRPAAVKASRVAAVTSPPVTKMSRTDEVTPPPEPKPLPEARAEASMPALSEPPSFPASEPAARSPLLAPARSDVFEGEPTGMRPERGAQSGASTASAGAGGGRGGESELRAYREQLSRRVTRQRRYPPQAMRLGMEGTARVWVRVNRDGSLGAPPRLEGSSRFGVLDAEALRMVEAAAPFAPLPETLAREAAEFVIPVSFALRVAG